METGKFPWFMLGLLVGLMLGFLLSDTLGHAQSYEPGQPVWRHSNQYDSGGVTQTPQGPVYDYGVPKYAPPAVNGAVPNPLFFFGLGQYARKEAALRAEVEQLTARIEQRRQARCLEIVRLQKFLELFGVERTASNGGCDGEGN